MAPAWSSIPIELWVHILDHADISLADYESLLHVCRHWRTQLLSEAAARFVVHRHIPGGIPDFVSLATFLELDQTQPRRGSFPAKRRKTQPEIKTASAYLLSRLYGRIRQEAGKYRSAVCRATPHGVAVVRSDGYIWDSRRLRAENLLYPVSYANGRLLWRVVRAPHEEWRQGGGIRAAGANHNGNPGQLAQHQQEEDEDEWDGPSYSPRCFGRRAFLEDLHTGLVRTVPHLRGSLQGRMLSAGNLTDKTLVSWAHAMPQASTIAPPTPPASSGEEEDGDIGGPGATQDAQKREAMACVATTPLDGDLHLDPVASIPYQPIVTAASDDDVAIGGEVSLVARSGSIRRVGDDCFGIFRPNTQKYHVWGAVPSAYQVIDLSQYPTIPKGADKYDSATRNDDDAGGVIWVTREEQTEAVSSSTSSSSVIDLNQETEVEESDPEQQVSRGDYFGWDPCPQNGEFGYEWREPGVIQNARFPNTLFIVLSEFVSATSARISIHSYDMGCQVFRYLTSHNIQAVDSATGQRSLGLDVEKLTRDTLYTVARVRHTLRSPRATTRAATGYLTEEKMVTFDLATGRTAERTYLLWADLFEDEDDNEASRVDFGGQPLAGGRRRSSVASATRWRWRNRGVDLGARRRVWNDDYLTLQRGWSSGDFLGGGGMEKHFLVAIKPVEKSVVEGVRRRMGLLEVPPETSSSPEEEHQTTVDAENSPAATIDTEEDAEDEERNEVVISIDEYYSLVDVSFCWEVPHAATSNWTRATKFHIYADDQFVVLIEVFTNDVHIWSWHSRMQSATSENLLRTSEGVLPLLK